MDLHEMRTLVEACTYKPGWIINFHAGDKERASDGYNMFPVYGRPYIQIEVTEEAEASTEASGPAKGERSPWKSAKRYLSEFMCRQEIIGVVFGLITDAEMHKAREWFRYKNASIFNPHLDPDVLAEVARKRASSNVRENAMSMQENTIG
ncbi:hypothetical protein HOS22_gp15 [Rhizobium phage RHEph08]|uniref:Uncharacterized protein n=1 Tax=Rhizobium phage RHEph08 TaxID=1220715 RepID=L7TNQ2_9CAUD|nr:hypothetical protein HOS22_gp15 [Rhizobium phage RHEph08]AGC35939.1 hypothetical protein RHEph08_gp015 [Rhizobium phage RHEph08]